MVITDDDVVTTGSTVAGCTRLLLRNGAATVSVWYLCRNLAGRASCAGVLQQ